MRVLYDYLAFDMQRYGGVSRCFVENYKHLPPNVCAEFGIVESDNIYLQELGVPPIGYAYNHFISRGHFPCKGRLFRLYNSWRGVYYGIDENKRRSIQLLQSGEYDILHPTFFDDYFLPYLHGKPFVLTIHDMIPELYPQYFGLHDIQVRMKRKLSSMASKIIAVSEKTKEDIVRILNIEASRIAVVYHGVNSSEFRWRKQRLIESRYFLYVGERDLYKNWKSMVVDLKPIFEKYDDVQLICTGSEFTTEEVRWLNSNGLKSRIKHVFAKSSEILATLYHYAEAFIYPSEYEGFGMPILESYACQCPVILNNASCFPEIAGDAAVFFKSGSLELGLCEAVEGLLQTDSTARNELIKRQLIQMKKYSWEQSAKDLTQIYKSVM